MYDVWLESAAQATVALAIRCELRAIMRDPTHTLTPAVCALRNRTYKVRHREVTKARARCGGASPDADAFPEEAARAAAAGAGRHRAGVSEAELDDEDDAAGPLDEVMACLWSEELHAVRCDTQGHPADARLNEQSGVEEPAGALAHGCVTSAEDCPVQEEAYPRCALTLRAGRHVFAPWHRAACPSGSVDWPGAAQVAIRCSAGRDSGRP